MKKITYKQIDKFTNAYKQGKHVQIYTNWHDKNAAGEWHDLIFSNDKENIEYIKDAVIRQRPLRIVKDE